MKAEMLQSQFDALEAPNEDEALILPITMPIAGIVSKILKL